MLKHGHLFHGQETESWNQGRIRVKIICTDDIATVQLYLLLPPCMANPWDCNSWSSLWWHVGVANRFLQCGRNQIF